MVTFNIVFLRWNYKMLLLYLTLKILFNSQFCLILTDMLMPALLQTSYLLNYLMLLTVEEMQYAFIPSDLF